MEKVQEIKLNLVENPYVTNFSGALANVQDEVRSQQAGMRKIESAVFSPGSSNTEVTGMLTGFHLADQGGTAGTDLPTSQNSGRGFAPLPQKPHPIDPLRPIEPIEPIDPPHPIDPIGPIDPIKPTKPIDPLHPIDPIEPIGPPDPLHPIDPIAPPEIGRPKKPPVELLSSNDPLARDAQVAGLAPHPGYCNPALPAPGNGSYDDWLNSQGMDPKHPPKPYSLPHDPPPNFDFNQPNKPYENPNHPYGPITVPCPPGPAVA